MGTGVSAHAAQHAILGTGLLDDADLSCWDDDEDDENDDDDDVDGRMDGWMVGTELNRMSASSSSEEEKENQLQSRTRGELAGHVRGRRFRLIGR